MSFYFKNYKIYTDNWNLIVRSYYGRPGDVLRSANSGYYNRSNNTKESVLELYHILKICGFDHSSCKALIDEVYAKKSMILH